MALAYNPDKSEIIKCILGGVKDIEADTQDPDFFCLDYTDFCSGTCLYCGKTRNNWDRKRLRLTKEEILETLRGAYEKGTRRFLLYGGADLFFDRGKITDIIKEFKNAFPDGELYLAAGEKVFEDYTAYKEAGLDGYILFHRSANADHFSKIHTLESYPDFRMKMLPLLREIGLKIGTGITVGWPYQTAEILAEDVAFLMELQPDLVMIDTFVPEKGSDFESFPKGDKKQREKVLKLVRKILPEVTILTHY